MVKASSYRLQEKVGPNLKGLLKIGGTKPGRWLISKILNLLCTLLKNIHK